MSLTKASYSMVTGAPANVLDFGAVGDGLTDSTSAIQDAIDSVAATGGGVYFPPGEYLISTSLTVSTYGVSLIGPSGAALWNGLTTVNDGGAIILKSAAMTTEAIVVTGGKFTMQDISLVGQAGNTGDGVYLKDAQSCVLLNVCVAKMGGDGIRIGTKSGFVGNCNAWQLTNVTSQYNSQHGVVLYDESTTVPVDGPNANAGTATGLNVAGNSGAGLRIINGQFNTFVGLLSQQNSGYGVALFGTALLSLYTTFVGGDIESNGDGNWFVSGDAKHVTIVGALPNVPVLDPDQFNTSFTSGTCSIRGVRFSATDNPLQYYVNGTGTPYIQGSSSAGFNTYASQYLFYTRIGNQISCEGSVQLSAKGTGGNAMSGNLQLWFDNAIPASLNSTGATSVFTLVPSGGFTVGAGFSPNMVGIMQPNTKYLTLYKVSTTDGSLTALTASDITDSFRVYFTGTYLTAI